MEMGSWYYPSQIILPLLLLIRALFLPDGVYGVLRFGTLFPARLIMIAGVPFVMFGFSEEG